MDVMKLSFPDNYFDCVIDKSTVDVLFCGDNALLNVATMMKEIQRVLKKKGTDIIVSFGTPDERAEHFEREHLSFEMKIFTLKKSLIKLEGKTEAVINNLGR